MFIHNSFVELLDSVLHNNLLGKKGAQILYTNIESQLARVNSRKMFVTFFLIFEAIEKKNYNIQTAIKLK